MLWLIKKVVLMHEGNKVQQQISIYICTKIKSNDHGLIWKLKTNKKVLLLFRLTIL